MERKREIGHTVHYRKSEGGNCYRKMKTEHSETEWVVARRDVIFNKVTKLAH